jgi:hypothetical protein
VICAIWTEFDAHVERLYAILDSNQFGAGVSRKWEDEDTGDMTGWAIAGREIEDGVGFAVGRNGD